MAKRSKRSSQKPDALTLAKANRFDPSALASNRRGQLTGSQMFGFALRLLSMAFSVTVTIAFGIVCVVLAVVLAPKDGFAENWSSLIFVALFFVFGLFWILDAIKHIVRDTFPLLRDVIGGQVTVEEGVVSRHYDDLRYASLWHRLFTWVFDFFADDHARHIKWFSGMHFYVLNKQEYTVTQKGYAALAKESFCRLYYASRSRRLVNIEPMPGRTSV